MANIKDYLGKIKPDWCPGCGDFGVLNALQRAITELDIPSHMVQVVSGIGCSSNLPGFINAYGFHGLHGRSLPVASGVKLGNHALTVIATGGDGDGYGIGVGHFVHTCRRNLDMTYIVMDNQIYGLTTGQASPTTEKDIRTKSTPEGTIETALSPMALALACGATYVARGFSGDNLHLAQLIKGAIEHKGFAVVDVFSPCVTYNKHNTYPWFREHIYKLEDERHDPSDFRLAMEKAFEWGARIPIGLFFKVERPTYEDEEPALRGGIPLVRQGVTRSDLSTLMESFL
ncbi:MAG: 2-oxoacid ferredoxin oxidoreductase [Omnitrophica bacterium RIFCSPHIGHO2_02_FULL_63_14]|nr:MAG: 2-oxoacid ferredoxin oxidoreductase [Omnitrophica bacterium RIFCSPHIGHO2_02_FULL_63_14]